jgi:predicted ATPase/DNA-binding CsgD family transcriptional regulator
MGDGQINMEKPVFIAREQQLNELIQGLDTLVQGNFSISLVTGPPGVGKSYLVKQAEKIFREYNCTYIKTKFPAYSQDLFTPAAEILDEIAKQILMLEPESFHMVQKALKEKLKADLNTIISLSPLSKKLFGPKSRRLAPEEMNEEAVVQAMASYIREAATILFPMIIFMDDVQWGDRISMKLIRTLFYTGSERNFYLILACRTPCNDDLDSFISHQSKIQLEPFQKEDIDRLLAEMLSLEGNSGNYVSSLLFRLSQGNPFYISFLIQRFKENGALTASDGGWKWDMEKFSAMQLPDHIEDVLIEELEELPLEERKILELMSDFGGSVSEDILNLFVQGTRGVKNDPVDRLFEKAFVIRSNQGEMGIKEYALVHDILHEVLYKTQSMKSRKERYGNIATVLANNGYGETAPVMVASFLLESDEKRLTRSSKVWADILWNAGNMSQERGNINRALKFLRLGEKLLNIDPSLWDRQQRVTYHLAFLKALYVNEEGQEAREFYEQLLREYPEATHQVEIKMVYIYCHAFNGEWENVLVLGREILALLGFKLSYRQVIWNLMRTRLMYNKKRVSRILEVPSITDSRILKILEVLVAMFPAANRTDTRLFTLINLKLAFLSGKHGDSPYACIGYASFCYVLYFVFKDFCRGNQLQEKTLKLLQDSGHNFHRSIAYAMLGTFTYHWTHSLQDTFQCLQKSIQSSDREGEYLYSNYAFVFSTITLYVMGKPLSVIERYIHFQSLRDRRLEDYLTDHMSQVYRFHMEGLRSGTEETVHLEGLEKDSYEDTINLNADMLKLHRLYLENRYREAYELVLHLDSEVNKYPGFILNGHYEFFALLVRMAFHPLLSSEDSYENHKKILTKISDLRRWKERYEPNHGHRYYIAQAEYQYYFEKKTKGSEDLYNQAIAIAKGQNDYQMEALANMLAARHGFANEMITRIHGSEAARLFEKWGASHIACLVRREFMLPEETIRGEPEGSRPSEERQWMDGLRAMKDAETHDSFLLLVDYLVDNNYCNRCSIFLEKKGRLYLSYERSEGQNGVHHEKGIALNYLEKVPHKLIRYVARTGEFVRLGYRQQESPLINEYWQLVRDTQEIVCMPLKNGGILAGVLYMEKGESLEKDIKSRVDFLYSLTAPSMKNANHTGETFKDVPTENLTPREIDILRLVGDGFSNIQISKQLFLAEGTVRNHLSNIYGKMNVESRIQAVLVGRERGII